jgi:hypothetical protein
MGFPSRPQEDLRRNGTCMSEYQYVGFRAIDAPVSEKNLEYMHAQSLRAEISAWSFDNEQSAKLHHRGSLDSLSVSSAALAFRMASMTASLTPACFCVAIASGDALRKEYHGSFVRMLVRPVRAVHHRSHRLGSLVAGGDAKCR